MASDEPDNEGLPIAPPPVAYWGALALGLLLDKKVHVPFLPDKVARPAGGMLLGSGILLMGWFAFTFRRARTPFIGEPFIEGKPVPRLITDGPFRYSRNPGYLSWATIYAGIAALKNALWAILLLPVVLFVTQRSVIEREERYLECTFGEQYVRYRARVPRWI